ncbi:unnamed protein product [Paramecium octaurelia]|uniref:Uncharacterized protein n=1 Tax=Paramecium octaurelia TaxID=43137 RepID=A0A8S1WSJ9_PAROT|nr:unnamed protein product [Paramecium octaurelia]
MQQNNSPPSTASFVLEKLKHYRKSHMSFALRNLLSTNSNKSKTTTKPFMKLFSSSNCNSPLPRDISLFEHTQDQTTKQLDLSNMHEFEYKMTPQSQLNSFSRDLKLVPFISAKRYNKLDKRYYIILYFEENSSQFQELIRRKDAERMIHLFQKPMFIAQEQNLIELFSYMIYLLAQFFFDCQEYSKATYFLKDCFTLSNLSRNPKLKVNSLLSMAICAKQFKLFDQQIILIQKALMYSWAYYYHDEEIQCYDAMGLAYFYQGNIERAEFYHQKWSSGFLEEPSSYYRVTALEFISMFERTLPTKAVDFMSSIQGSISVPFVNIATGRNYDDRRFIKYNNCNPLEIIYSITKTKEFMEFNLIHHEQTLVLNQQTKKQPKLPKRILEITEKYHKNKDLYSFNHKIMENPKYKLSLQQQVDFRMTQSFSIQEVNSNVKKFISSQREPFMKAQQIYIRANNKQKEFIPAVIMRYQKMLTQILK